MKSRGASRRLCRAHDTQIGFAQATVNRNKRSLTLDLRRDEGREIFLKLAARSDIIVQNFRPGTFEKWGVGYDHVRAVKPDIVYVSISGYGQFGPIHDRVAYDPLAQAMGGFVSLNGSPDGPPTKAPTWLCDDLGGLHGAIGALAALRHRDQTGEGQHVDVAMLDAMLFQSNGNLTLGAMGLEIKRWGNEFPFSVPANTYQCRDGLVMAGVLLDTHWKVLARMAGRHDLAGRDDFATMPGRMGNRDECDAMFAEWCASRTVEQAVDECAKEGIACAKVRTYAEAARCPHTLERDMLQQVAAGRRQASRRSPGRQRSSRARRREYEPARPLWERIRMKSWRNSESTSRRASVCARVASSSERPHPPPPGVSIRMRSPALRSIFALPGRLLASRAAHENIFAGRARPSTGESVRRDCPPLGEHAHVRIDQAFEFANQSVAAARLPAATRAAPDSILSDSHRIVSLERFDRRVERVGHVSVDAGRTGPILRRARAAGDRFVVGKMAVAKSIEAADREIRHRARTRRRNSIRRGLGERAKQHIDNPLRGLDVSARDRCRSQRVDDRAGRRDELDRTHQAFVGGHRLGRETLHDVESCRQSDRVICVDRCRAPAARSR